MADSYDNADCYTADEFYQNYPDHGTRFAYIRMTSTQKSEGYTDQPRRHFLDTTVRNYSYVVWLTGGSWYKQCYWTNDANDSVDSGYWQDENHYVKPANPSDDIVEAFTIKNCSYGRYCNSSTDDRSRSTGEDSWFNNCDASFVGNFQRVRNSDGEVHYVSSVAEIYKKSGGTITRRWEDTDNGGTGIGGNTHIWTHYDITVDLLDLRGSHEVPYIFDVTMPTTHAWKRDENIDWTEGIPNLLETQVSYNFLNRALASWYMNSNNTIKSGLLPKTLEWAKPYPNGKWYRDTNGALKNRGLPDALIDYQGAFNKCTNLVEVTIPETVKSIGRYSFRETNLKSVKIARDCTYYDTSFPSDCRIYFYGGGTVTINSIADMESRQIESLATMTINELEGN